MGNIKQAKDSLKKALTARRAAERAEMKAIKDLIAAGDEYREMGYKPAETVDRVKAIYAASHEHVRKTARLREQAGEVVSDALRAYIHACES